MVRFLFLINKNLNKRSSFRYSTHEGIQNPRGLTVLGLSNEKARTNLSVCTYLFIARLLQNRYPL